MYENKIAKALIANETIEKIILERHLFNAIPISNKFSLKKVSKYIGINYSRLQKYIESDLYTINKDTIYITENKQLLSDKSKKYIEDLIKEVIRPEKYKNNKFVYCIAKFFDNSYYSKAEQEFIDLMVNEFFAICNRNTISHRISFEDLIGFLNINHNPFQHTARQVYNDILQKKICAGDNIIKYIKEHLTDIQFTRQLEKSYKYDCFFDNNGILKCDLDTNINILIKNFLCTIIYGLTDNDAKIILLMKLNAKYPFLISEKIFDEYS